MNRRAAGWVLGAALLLAGGAVAWWWLAGRGGAAGARSPSAATVAGPPGERRTFDLYFPAESELLRAEHRDLEVPDSPKERIRKLVEALLAGPTQSGMERAFPAGVTLGSVQLSPDGTAYVDLRWADHPDPPGSGSSEEIQRIYSLVNTIAFNVPQAARVVVLWNGTQRMTLGGHLDTSRPLVPDRALLAR
jgi:hypothetical protein